MVCGSTVWGTSLLHCLPERNATGITDSRTDVTLPDDTCYDLLGRRVERLVPGRVYLSTRRGVFLQSK